MIVDDETGKTIYYLLSIYNFPSKYKSKYAVHVSDCVLLSIYADSMETLGNAKKK